MAQPLTRPELLSHLFLKLAQWRVAGFAAAGYIFKSKQTKQTFLATSTDFAACCNSLAWAADSFTELAFAPQFRALTSPNPLLFSTTLEQYIQADNLHNAFISERKPQYMNRLIATYWKRNGKTPTRQFSAASRMQAFIWFAGVKRYIANRYPALFVSSAGIGPQPDAAQQVINILSAINGGDVTKNEIILRTHVHEVFHELNALAEQHKNHNANVHTV